MKILFVSTVHPSPPLPTMGTFNRVLLEALRREGHEVRAVVPIGWRHAGTRPLPTGGDTEWFRWWYLPILPKNTMHRSLSRRLRAFWQRRSRGWKPDVVVGYWVDPDGTAAMDLADALHVPGVMLVGGTDLNELSRDATRGSVIRQTLLRARAVITIGNALATRAAELGVPVQRLHVFQRGVDRSIFHPGDRDAARARLQIPTGRAVLLWVGRMVPVKGVDTLLRAASQLQRSIDTHVYLLGSGPLESTLRDQAQQLGITEKAHFIGPVAHQDLADWYRAADIVVLPSRSEGVPNVLLEALACGTPFVGSHVGSVPELAEAPEWLVPPDDPDALANALGGLLKSQPQVRQSTTDDRGAARQFVGVLTETVESFAEAVDTPPG